MSIKDKFNMLMCENAREHLRIGDEFDKFRCAGDFKPVDSIEYIKSELTYFYNYCNEMINEYRENKEDLKLWREARKDAKKLLKEVNK